MAGRHRGGDGRGLRSERRRVFAARLHACVPALLLLACSSSSTPNRRTLIDSRDQYDPRSLDPALSTDVPTGRAVGYLFDGLTRFDAEAHVLPALAERWEISPDGLRYTFHLRHGVRFHDGGAFSSRNVV